MCSFSNHGDYGMRQATTYGIGVIAKTCSHDIFDEFRELCLESVSTATKFKPDAEIQSDNQKLHSFHYSRDNAITALGNILRH